VTFGTKSELHSARDVQAEEEQVTKSLQCILYAIIYILTKLITALRHVTPDRDALNGGTNTHTAAKPALHWLRLPSELKLLPPEQFAMCVRLLFVYIGTISNSCPCQFCQSRPQYFDGTKAHPYCSRTCAKASTSVGLAPGPNPLRQPVPQGISSVTAWV
jgi:hypothetical protein